MRYTGYLADEMQVFDGSSINAQGGYLGDLSLYFVLTIGQFYAPKVSTSLSPSLPSPLPPFPSPSLSPPYLPLTAPSLPRSHSLARFAHLSVS